MESDLPPSLRSELKTAVGASIQRRKTKLKALTLRSLSKLIPVPKQPRSSPFMALPPEIRMKIYGYVFQDTLIWDGKSSGYRADHPNEYDPYPRVDPSWKWIKGRLFPAYFVLLFFMRFSSPITTTTFILQFLNHLPAGGNSLLRLNRKIAVEARHVLYSKFTFCFTLRAFGNLPNEEGDLGHEPRAVQLATRFLNQIGEAACASLSHLELTLIMPSFIDTGDALADANSKSRAQLQWTTLCRSFNAKFTHLRSISIFVHPSPTDRLNANGQGESMDRVLEVAWCFGDKAQIIPFEKDVMERYDYKPDGWQVAYVRACSTRLERQKEALKLAIRSVRKVATWSTSHGQRILAADRDDADEAESAEGSVISAEEDEVEVIEEEGGGPK